MKYTFSFKEISYGSIELEADHVPDIGEVTEAIINGGAYIDDTEYEDILLDGERGLNHDVSKTAEKEIVQGYEIKRDVMFENNRGFVLAECLTAPDPYVTWQFTEDEDGRRDYYRGHYKTNMETATRDYENRVAGYFEDKGIPEKSAYRYYSTQRPVDIGTFPKTENGPIRLENFDKREDVEQGKFKAWGYLVYDAPLTGKEIFDHELRPAPDNFDYVIEKNKQVQPTQRQIAKAQAAEAREEQKLFADYCLQNAPFSSDVKREMIALAQIVGHWEEWKRLPDNERYTWHKPSIQAFALREPVVDPKLLNERNYQAIDEISRAERQAVKKPIMEQLADAQKQVERGADVPAKNKNKSHEDR